MKLHFEQFAISANTVAQIPISPVLQQSLKTQQMIRPTEAFRISKDLSKQSEQFNSLDRNESCGNN